MYHPKKGYEAEVKIITEAEWRAEIVEFKLVLVDENSGRRRAPGELDEHAKVTLSKVNTTNPISVVGHDAEGVLDSGGVSRLEYGPSLWHGRGGDTCF